MPRTPVRSEYRPGQPPPRASSLLAQPGAEDVPGEAGVSLIIIFKFIWAVLGLGAVRAFPWLC